MVEKGDPQGRDSRARSPASDIRLNQVHAEWAFHSAPGTRASSPLDGGHRLRSSPLVVSPPEAPPHGPGLEQGGLLGAYDSQRFLPGSPIHETGLDAGPTSPASRPGASLARLARSSTMRGAVMAPALSPAFARLSSRASEDARLIPASAVLPRGSFTLRGELLHAFVSYRVATEGIYMCVCVCIYIYT